MAVTVPIVVGSVLAATVGGWASVAVAVVGYGAVMVLLAMIARYVVRSWRPLRSLIRAAGRVADGDYGARADPRGTAAFTPITSSFNRMAERLETAERERHRLLADIGHELRTPLTMIRGEVEAIIDGVHQPDPDRLRALLSDVAVMEHLLDDLRTLST
ncbi:MAG: histidine kinase dimerization/phospho-acceptor domain-containing protein, partial [Actinomycetota bacterium]